MGLRFVNGSGGYGLNRLKIIKRPVIESAITKRELEKLDRSIRIAESDLILSQSPKSLIFKPHGPFGPVFLSTPPGPFLRFIKDMKIERKGHFADLGSGSGRIGLPASYYFKRVTLFERDHRLCNLTRRIMKGYNIANVTLKNADFLRQSIEPFDVIYFFRPFREDYCAKMENLIRTAKPGATLIFTSVREFELIDPKLFSFIYPAVGPDAAEPAVGDFFAVKRI